MTMTGPVTMLNTFVSGAAAQEAGLPEQCGVYGVSALLRQLIDDAIDLPALYDVDGRAGKLMALLVAEIATMPRLSLHAPLPADARLAKVCRHLLASPSIAADLDQVAADAGEPPHVHAAVPCADGREFCRMAPAGVHARGDRAPERRAAGDAGRARSRVCERKRVHVGVSPHSG